MIYQLEDEKYFHLIENPKFKFMEGTFALFRSSEKFDLILHLAGHASPDEYQKHPIETLQTSSFGSANMAELARKNDATLSVCFNFRSIWRRRNCAHSGDLLGKSQPDWTQIMLR